MPDFFTFCIYISLLFSVILLTIPDKGIGSGLQKSALLERWNYKYVLALLAISFVSGFRYDVGVDWLGYKIDYERLHLYSKSEFSDQYYEYGFFALSKILGSFRLGSEWLFFIVAFISWGFVIKASPKYILPLVLFFLFADEFFFWSMNGVRQFAAMAFWLTAISFIPNKKITSYFVFILLGSMFHSSILLFLPLYFINYRKFYNHRIFIILFVLSVLLGSYKSLFLDSLVSFIELHGSKFDVVSKYGRYTDSSLLSSTDIGLGFGFYIKVFVNFIIILFSKKIVDAIPALAPYFFLCSVGVILFNLFYDVQLIGRINQYLLVLKSITLAAIAFYYWNFFNKRYIAVLIIVLHISLFVGAIYTNSNKCAPYSFIF